MFLRTSGKRPLTSGTAVRRKHREDEERLTLLDGHAGNDPLDSIFALFSIFAVEVGTELKVFAFARGGTDVGHGSWTEGDSVTSASRRALMIKRMSITTHAHTNGTV